MATPIRVLLVEDSENDAILIKRELLQGGYEPDMLRVQTSKDMIKALKEKQWDLIISDYMMPEFTAPAALEILKATGLDIPFIIVSGTIGEDIAVISMKAGANDFMGKSSLARLVPAIEREIREAEDRKQRRKAEEDLKRSEERYRRVAENAPDVIFRLKIHPELATEYVSPVSKAMLGRDPEEFYADPQVIIQSVHKDYQSIIEEFMQVPPRMSGPLVLRMLHKDGRSLWGEVRFVPIFSHTGRYIALEGIIRDVTERKRMEEKLEQRTKDSEASSVRAQTYLEFMSHDIANILTPVSTYAQMAAQSKDIPDNAKKYCEKIIVQIDQASAFVKNVRKLSRLEIGKQTGLEFTDAKAALSASEDRIRADYPEKTISIEYQMPNETPIRVTGHGHVEEVFNEVYDNAAKYSKGGVVKIEVTVQPMKMADKDLYWMFKIADHGPGIPDTDKKMLMGEDLAYSKSHGRGVVSTLSFMSLIVEQLGGWMLIGDRVFGNHEEGASIIIVIPRQDQSRG